MIQLPRRSITRFFIPLIDVLTLLFCIFLLMPLIKPINDAQEWNDLDTANEPVPPASTEEVHPLLELAQAEKERLRQERLELEQLRKDKREVLQQRLFLRVLEIDADTGKLFYQEGDQRLPIDSQAAALQLIDKHRQEADERELYYLFLYPRRLTGYPLRSQVQQYENWFRNVAHGTDNPHQTR